jgi:hypothetical protein
MSPVANEFQPIRITLLGKYWDSQIYSGTLYLFNRDGGLTILNWDRFVQALPISEELRFVAEAVLLGNDRFYSEDIHRLIQDPEIRPVILDKIRRLRRTCEDQEFSPALFSSTATNPLPFPHNDSEVYYGQLYVGTTSGVFRLSREQSRSRAKTASRVTDAPALDIASKYSVMAIAAGEEGLLETQLVDETDKRTSRVADKRCISCEWSYASLVCSDDTHSLFVAAFARVPEDIVAGPTGRRKRYVRRFEGVITGAQLFGPSMDPEETMCWGAKDKLYSYRSGNIQIVRNRSNGRASFSAPQSRSLVVEANSAGFVTARAAPFGSVLEFDDRLVVLFSSGELHTLAGEPVNWRVFPQSRKYVSHLHVVYEDRIEILAFVHDYFLSENERFFGTEALDFDERVG